MAKKPKKAVEVEIDEDDDLEDLEDLEDLADATVEADDDEEEDEDEEAPKKKKKKEKAKTASDSVGSADLAEALGTDGKNLRVMLRARKVAKNENGRYEWDSVDAALTALGFDALDEAKSALKEARDERLEKLKADGAKKKKAAKPADDEDEDEDDEEEEDAPPPKKKKKKK